ncbi:hypothetical protein F8388_013344 [Cannabis sativa]|uniref:Dirigent protein n=1 Tax=Cannabis sativa TaxID=3483 RepID=A0A7J6FED6_CANSA|nr:hypothetical protein F8388_013344 [Cannabis sativa]
MAKALQTTTLNLLISLTFVFSFLRLTTANDDYYNLVQRKHGFKHEKLTHFHFYFHSKWQEPDERPSGRGANDEHFGHIFWHGRSVRRPFDGGTRANFQAGKYNGSCLSILGHNSILSALREMPVVGGTGLFRFARGYALAKTYMYMMTFYMAQQYAMYASYVRKI